MTRKLRRVRVTAVSRRAGVVTMTLRRAGRIVGTGRRSVRAGREFKLAIRTRITVRPGRYTLTITLRRTGGRRWTASEPVSMR